MIRSVRININMSYGKSSNQNLLLLHYDKQPIEKDKVAHTPDRKKENAHLIHMNSRVRFVVCVVGVVIFNIYIRTFFFL